jgi:hypothetical protein
MVVIFFRKLHKYQGDMYGCKLFIFFLKHLNRSFRFFLNIMVHNTWVLHLISPDSSWLVKRGKNWCNLSISEVHPVHRAKKFYGVVVTMTLLKQQLARSNPRPPVLNFICFVCTGRWVPHVRLHQRLHVQVKNIRDLSEKTVTPRVTFWFIEDQIFTWIASCRTMASHFARSRTKLSHDRQVIGLQV